MSIDEKQLIEESQKGDKLAFGKLVNHYKEKAYSIALGYVGSMDDAYDLSQEAIINAYRHLDSFVGLSRFTAVLFWNFLLILYIPIII